MRKLRVKMELKVESEKTHFFISEKLQLFIDKHLREIEADFEVKVKDIYEFVEYLGD